MTPEVREHRKGGEAVFVGISTNSETGARSAVYTHVESETGEIKLWDRPLGMFLENVPVDGQEVPRFKHLRDATDEEIIAAIREAAKNAPNI